MVWLLFCHEANGWCVRVGCCSVRRPMAGMCELVAVLSVGQWLACASLLLFCQEANGWRV